MIEIGLILMQALRMLFYPFQADDEAAIEEYAVRARAACADNGGVGECSCRSNPNWTSSDLKANATELLFCLPRNCSCRDGARKEIPLMVR